MPGSVAVHGHILIRVPAAEADALAAIVGSLPGVTGLEERPASGAPLFAVDPAFAVVEYGSGAARQFARWLQSESFRGAGCVLLCAYVAVRDAAAWRRWRRALPRRCPGLRILRHGLVAPRDYQAGVHARWRGRCVGRRLWVGPPWVNPPTDRLAVVIEPGLAFGTGDHPTTRLCLAALDRLSARRFCVRRVFDVGTGSGVLAIAAAKLFGRCDLWLGDLDAQCTDNARRNFRRNRLGRRRTHAFWGPPARLDRIRAPAGGFDLVVSNLYLDGLHRLARRVARLLRPGGRWIVSGLLAGDQEREFLAELPGSLTPITIRRSLERRVKIGPWRGLTAGPQGWVCVELEKPTNTVRGGSCRVPAVCVR